MEYLLKNILIYPAKGVPNQYSTSVNTHNHLRKYNVRIHAQTHGIIIQALTQAQTQTLIQVQNTRTNLLLLRGAIASIAGSALLESFIVDMDCQFCGHLKSQ